MSKSYYAVKNGNKIGIFESWEECQESITGFKGQKFKKFDSLEKAKSYIENDELDNSEIESCETEDVISIDKIGNDEIIVYTDGSYTPKTPYVSYGCVCLMSGRKEYTISGVTTDKYSSNQVYGEIKGVLESIDYAIYKGFKKVYIMYDYEGLGNWVNGNWKTKNQISMDYIDDINKRKEKIEIEFFKVSAHTGNKYNDIADKLAKYELKSLEPSKEDDYGFRSYRYSDDEIESSLEKIKLLVENFNFSKEVKNNHIVYVCVVGKERLTFQKYNFNSGNALIIPKRDNEKIFQLIISFLNDKSSIDTILLNLNTSNNTTIDKMKIKEKLIEIAPSFKNVTLNIDIYRLLVQGIYNLFLNIDDVEDSSYITAPVLRALEGQLKYVFKNELSIDVTNFSYFDKKNSNYELQEIHANKTNPKNVDYINRCYNYYHAIRHKLFHFGDLDISDTKLMNTKESKEIIVNTIILIEEYYK